MNNEIRGRQDSNLRRRCLVDFESTPVTAWVRPHIILSYVFLNILLLHPRTAKKLDEKGIDPLASRMLSERSTTELHTRMFGVYGIFKVELNTPSINECQPCLGSIVVVRLIRNQKVVGSIPTRGFFPTPNFSPSNERAQPQNFNSPSPGIEPGFRG